MKKFEATENNKFERVLQQIETILHDNSMQLYSNSDIRLTGKLKNKNVEYILTDTETSNMDTGANLPRLFDTEKLIRFVEDEKTNSPQVCALMAR